MHRFWSDHVKPLIEAAAPARMIEVGAEFGWNTERILAYCAHAGCHLDVVDPVPHPSLLKVLAGFPDQHSFHGLRSTDALPILPAADLILLDGDHNWYTVYNELQLIFIRAARAEVPPPIVLFHDCAWPYARRDMYYDPGDIIFDCRQPYASRGIIPGQSELSDDGINGKLMNALTEGGPRNGVLTGIEDFIAGNTAPKTFYTLPFFNGLGVLLPDARATPAVRAVIEGFYSPEAMMNVAKRLELDGMNVRVDLAATQHRLTRRTEALLRARETILDLEREVAALRGSEEK